MKDLRFPVYEVIRKPKLPLLVGFRFNSPEYGALIDHMEASRKWTGVAWFLTMAKPRKPRTTGEKSQNHHLNGHVQQICIATGNTFDSVKRAVKMRAVDMGLPFTTLPNGDIDPMSEADMSTDQCALAIEASHQIAAEWGILLIEGVKTNGKDI